MERAHAYRSIDGFRNQWGLEHIKADVAYRHLELLKGPDAQPGAGVTLGFIDSGIDPDHPMFAGKNVVEEFTPGVVDETGIDDVSHGTVEASIAAGGLAIMKQLFRDQLSNTRAGDPAVRDRRQERRLCRRLHLRPGLHGPGRGDLSGIPAEQGVSKPHPSEATSPEVVIPASPPSFPRKRESRRGGRHSGVATPPHPWIPAFAGMNRPGFTGDPTL